MLLRTVGATEAAVEAGIGVRNLADIGCSCLKPGARIGVVWVTIDRAHQVSARAWSDRTEATKCFVGAFGAARPSVLASVTAAVVFQNTDRSRQVELPGPFTSTTLKMNVVGDTAGALWPTSELDTKLAVAGQAITSCATSLPARALVLIEIEDSRIVRTEVGASTVSDKCIRAALVGESVYRPTGAARRDGALVLDLAWTAP
jgi:hypothetical protein